MATTTTSRISPRTSWEPSSSHANQRDNQRPSRTPFLPPPSVGQPFPPRTPRATVHPGSQSPNYFGRVVDPSNENPNSDDSRNLKNKWSPPTSSIRSTAAISPMVLPLDANPEFEAFRKQSESNQAGNVNLSNFTLKSKNNRPSLDMPEERVSSSSRTVTQKPASKKAEQNSSSFSRSSQPNQSKMLMEPPSFFDIPRHASPATIPLPQSPTTQRTQLSYLDDRHPRLSLPTNRLDPPSPASFLKHASQRSSTLPSAMEGGAPKMFPSSELAELMKSAPQNILLLDLRVFPQYAKSRITGAINLCISTMLLKRPSFTVQKLADTFTNDDDKSKFMLWSALPYIVVYDDKSATLKDATSSVNTLKKFTNEGWHGTGLILQGGFNEMAKKFPSLIELSDSNSGSTTNIGKKSCNLLKQKLPVAGGCMMPATKNAANPFFGNIRQNMDLICGVGQMDLKRPKNMSQEGASQLPSWLKVAADEKDHGKRIAERFLSIEQDEQRRMQQALSCHVSYGSPLPVKEKVQIAGIEKGSKNRYNNIWPFDHTRVKLQNCKEGSCDYINANHVKAKWSNKRYIATQGPIPTTFDDFWRCVWEQDVRVIVMLTAEQEAGQLKCHQYWKGKEFGKFRLTNLSERRVGLEPLRSSSTRPSPGSRRRSNTSHTGPPSAASQNNHTPSSPVTERPNAIVRKFSLSDSTQPFAPMREITQLQYSSWPDLGAPANAADIIGLVEQVDAVVRNTNSPILSASQPEQFGQRPVLVHCSAGCGRTGTFCTIDSVLDMLKRQLLQREKRRSRATSPMEIDSGKSYGLGSDGVTDDDDWVLRENIDLVSKAVEELRDQRLSMVQTLRQFVLCYESVMEWLVHQQPETFLRSSVKVEGGDSRRSYQG